MHRVEPAFSSKLVATIRPEMPVYDKQVRENLCLKVPDQHKPADVRLQGFIVVYSTLAQTVSALIQDPVFSTKLRPAFDKKFPSYVHFTDVKKLDLLLWQYRKEGPDEEVQPTEQETHGGDECWRCFLCGRSCAEIGVHPLPIRQRAHLLPNRLTGGQRRYGGAKNVFTEAEWDILLRAIGPELRVDLSNRNQVRKEAMTHCYSLWGECHEEVLSEPLYLPSVMNLLKKRFKGQTRVEKILLLARVLKLGTEALGCEDGEQPEGAE